MVSVWKSIVPGGSQPRLAGLRSFCLSSQLDLLGNAERVIDLDAEIAHRAFELCVAEQQLNHSQIPCPLVDLGRLCTPHRVSDVGGAVQPGARDPGVDDPGICRVERCGCSRKRLGKRYCRLPAVRLESQSSIDARVCSVISNWTGRPIFF